MKLPMVSKLAWSESSLVAGAPSSYVDFSVVNSVLAGLLILVLALWAKYLLNRLWQVSLRADAASAICGAEARGLQLQGDGVKARVVAVGARGSEPVRVEWRGGWRGAHTVLFRGDQVVWSTFVRTESELMRLLDDSA